MWINEQQDFSDDPSGRPQFEDSAIDSNDSSGDASNGDGTGSIDSGDQRSPIEETIELDTPIPNAGADRRNRFGDLLGNR